MSKDTDSSIINELQSIIHSLEDMEKLRKRAENSINNTREFLNNTSTVLTGKTKEVAKCANDYVSRNPWTSISIAAVFAFMLGFFLKRK